MANRLSKDNYSFRIYSLNKRQLQEFEKMCAKLDFTVGQLRKKNDITRKIQKFTIHINLAMDYKNDEYINQIINFIKKNKIPESSYGLWISLSENRDHGGLTVPEHVKDFYFRIYSQIGGQIDFSYIFVDS